MADEYEVNAVNAAKKAKQAMMLTGIAVIVAIIVLIIDNGIKKSILAKADEARGLLEQVRTLAKEAGNERATEAGNHGNVPGSGVNGSNGMGGHAAARTVVDQAVSAVQRPEGDSETGVENRSPGNGRRTRGA